MNFVVMKSGFGDYWIGGTKLEADEKVVFSDFESAIEKAEDLNDSIENQEELEEMTEEEVEEILEGTEKFIVGFSNYEKEKK